MNGDRRTKAQILAELEKAEAALQKVENDRPATPQRVPEAEALAACLRALDPLVRNGNSNRYEFGNFKTASGSVSEVVGYLIAHFEIKPAVVVRDCGRSHLDDASEGALIEALRNKPMSGAFR